MVLSTYYPNYDERGNNKYYQEKYSDIELEINRRVNEEVNKRMSESIDVLIKTLQPSNY